MSDNKEAYFLERRCNDDLEHIVRLTYATGARLSKDGSEWCYLLGDNLQIGVCGFGPTPMSAATAFWNAYTKLPKEIKC